MYVGVARVVLLVPGAQSLKDKRQVVRRVRDRVLARFDCAVAEVGSLDEHQRAELGFSVVGGDRRVLERVLGEVVEHAIESGEGRVMTDEREVMQVGEELGRPPVAHWEPEAPNPPQYGRPEARPVRAAPGPRPTLRSSHRRGRP